MVSVSTNFLGIESLPEIISSVSALSGFFAVGLLFLIISLIAFIFALVGWVFTSVGIQRILESVGLKDKYGFQAWIPFWQFACLADLLEDYGDEVESLGEVTRGLAIIKAVSLFISIPVFGSLFRILYWICILYILARISALAYGHVNLWHMVLAVIGFDFVVFFIYGNYYLSNKFEIMNRRNKVDISNEMNYNEDTNSTLDEVKEVIVEEVIEETDVFDNSELN